MPAGNSDGAVQIGPKSRLCRNCGRLRHVRIDHCHTPWREAGRITATMMNGAIEQGCADFLRNGRGVCGLA
jgi:hypothetical protein